MKILHLADLHIGKTVSGFSLIKEQEEVLTQVLDILDEEKVESLIIAGDIYDKSIPPREAVILYNHFLAEVALKRKIPILAISGNHDSRERLEAGNQLSKEAGYYVEGVLKEDILRITLQDQWGDVDFYLIAFADLPRMKELYPNEEIKTYQQGWRAVMKSIVLRKGVRSVAIAHCYATKDLDLNEDKKEIEIIDSQKPLSIGGKDFMEGELFQHFSYGALGHLHRSQKVIQDHIRYSGTLLKYSFSEEKHEKTATLVDLKEDGEVSIDFIGIKQPRKWRSIKGYFQDILEKAPSDPGKEDFVRFILEDSGFIVDAMPRLKEYYPYAMELLYQRKEKQRNQKKDREQRGKISMLEMLNGFYEELYDHQTLPPELKEMSGSILEEMEEKEEKIHEA